MDRSIVLRSCESSGDRCRSRYLHTYLPTYTYLPTLPINLPIYLPTYLPTYLSTYLPTYLPTYTYLPTFQPTPIYLPSYSPKYKWTNDTVMGVLILAVTSSLVSAPSGSSFVVSHTLALEMTARLALNICLWSVTG